MKKAMFGMSLAAMMLLCVTTVGMAGMGPGGGQGGGFFNITSGEPFEYSGTVLGCDPGQGMTIETANGEVEIVGIGPYFYWEDQGVQRPAAGDHLVVTGYKVEANGGERNVAMAITLEGEKTVQLRDEKTGVPLWRGMGGQGRGGRWHGGHHGRLAGNRADCPYRMGAMGNGGCGRGPCWNNQ